MRVSSFLLLVLGSLVSVGVRGTTLDQYEIFVREPPSAHSDDSYDLFGYTAVLHNLVDPTAAGASFNDIINNAR